MKVTSRVANRRARAEANATPKQRKNRALRQAMPLAMVERPLRLIRSRTEIRGPKGELVGYTPTGEAAIEAAARGNGANVQRIARGMA